MHSRLRTIAGFGVPCVLLLALLVLVFTRGGGRATAGLELVQLTFDGPGIANEFPVASLDGRYLLFQRCEQPGMTRMPDGRISYDFKEDASNWDIYRMRTDGSELLRLTDAPGVEDEPAWSPDGQTIAYRFSHDATFAIWLMDADGRNKRPLVENPNWHAKTPAFSPDGTKVLFYANRAERHAWNVFTIDLASREVRQLTHGVFQDKHPQMTADGRAVVFHSDRNQLTIKTSTTHTLMRVFSMDLGTGKFTTLADTKDLRDDRHAFVSPDDRHVVYHSLGYGPDPANPNQFKKVDEGIYVTTRDGSQRLNVTEGDPRYFKHPSWSADGKKIYCVFKHRRGVSDSKGNAWNLCCIDVSAVLPRFSAASRESREH